MNYQIAFLYFNMQYMVKDVYAKDEILHNKTSSTVNNGDDDQNGILYWCIASGSLVGVCFIISGICLICKFCCASIKSPVLRVQPVTTHIDITRNDRLGTRVIPRANPTFKFNLHRQLQENVVNVHRLRASNNGRLNTNIIRESQLNKDCRPPDYDTACKPPPSYSVEYNMNYIETEPETAMSPPPPYNVITN